MCVSISPAAGWNLSAASRPRPPSSRTTSPWQRRQPQWSSWLRWGKEGRKRRGGWGWKVRERVSYPSLKWTVGSQTDRQVQSGKACGNVCFSPDPPTGLSANHRRGSGNSGQVLRMCGSKKKPDLELTSLYCRCSNKSCLWFLTV